MEVLLRDPRRYLPIVEFVDNVTQGLSELSWGECELIMGEVSKVNRAEFCEWIHIGIANGGGACRQRQYRSRRVPGNTASGVQCAGKAAEQHGTPCPGDIGDVARFALEVLFRQPGEGDRLHPVWIDAMLSR